MELCFLLLTHFLTDARTYVSKRPRVELVMHDFVRQCSLLSELVDGELEEDPASSSSSSLSSTDSISPLSTSFADLATEAFPASFSSSSSLSSLATTMPGTTPGTAESSKEAEFFPISSSSSPTYMTTGAAPSTTMATAHDALTPRLSKQRSSSLTQDFPFPGCPPTTFEVRMTHHCIMLHLLSLTCLFNVPS